MSRAGVHERARRARLGPRPRWCRGRLQPARLRTEKADALRKLAALIETIVHGEPGKNVVPLPTGGAAVNTDLSPAEIAEIDKLIEPGTSRPNGRPRTLSAKRRDSGKSFSAPTTRKAVAGAARTRGDLDGDYVYVREGDEAHEVPAGHPFLTEGRVV